jgi:hypothetical protein
LPKVCSVEGTHQWKLAAHILIGYYMSVCQRIRHAVSISKSDVFLKRDFAHSGSISQITRVLRLLMDEGVIVRISLGVYARAKFSALTGRPIPVKPVSVLAPEVLHRLGIEAHASKLVQEYNQGKSTQIPIGVVINTGRRRIRRKIGFGASQIKYEND